MDHPPPELIHCSSRRQNSNFVTYLKHAAGSAIGPESSSNETRGCRSRPRLARNPSVRLSHCRLDLDLDVYALLTHLWRVWILLRFFAS